MNAESVKSLSDKELVTNALNAAINALETLKARAEAEENTPVAVPKLDQLRDLLAMIEMKK